MAAIVIGLQVTIVAVTEGIRQCITLSRRATANQDLCIHLGVDFEIIEAILSSLSQEQLQRANKHHLKMVLCKLQNLNNKAKILFERCAQGKRLIRIKNFLQASKIRDELKSATAETNTIVNLLCLVFTVSQEEPRVRSLLGNRQLILDDALLDTLTETEVIEDYYEPDDPAN